MNSARATAVKVMASHGIPFTVRVVEKGDTYGAGFCLVHNEDDPMIEFYDARYIKPAFTPFGQFVSRYYLKTLMSSEYGESALVAGLCLQGDVANWRIDAEAIRDAFRALEIGPLPLRYNN